MQQVIAVENYWRLRQEGWATTGPGVQPREDLILVRVPFLLFHRYDEDGDVIITAVDEFAVADGFTSRENAMWTRRFADEHAARTTALASNECSWCGMTEADIEAAPWPDHYVLSFVHAVGCGGYEAERRRLARLNCEPYEPLPTAPATAAARPRPKRKRQGPPARNSRSLTSKGGE